MMSALDIDWFQGWLLAPLLVYCRIQACLLTIPVFGERFLPMRVKISLAMALTPLFAFGVALEKDAESVVQLAFLVMPEVVMGLLIGLMVRFLAIALDMAATAIAMTASLSQIVGVPNEYSPHPVGNLMHLAGLALLMVLGFPIMLSELIQDSFMLKPPGSWPLAEDIVPAAIGLVSQSFLLAMLLASPFILGGFLYQALSGVVSKVMPSLPIVFIGAPAAILLALLGLSVFTPTILAIWADAILNFSLPVLK